MELDKASGIPFLFDSVLTYWDLIYLAISFLIVLTLTISFTKYSVNDTKPFLVKVAVCIMMVALPAFVLVVGKPFAAMMFLAVIILFSIAVIVSVGACALEFISSWFRQ